MRFTLGTVKNLVPKATVAAFKYGHKKKRTVEQFGFRLGLKPRQDFKSQNKILKSITETKNTEYSLSLHFLEG